MLGFKNKRDNTKCRAYSNARNIAFIQTVLHSFDLKIVFGSI